MHPATLASREYDGVQALHPIVPSLRAVDLQSNETITLEKRGIATIALSSYIGELNKPLTDSTSTGGPWIISYMDELNKSSVFHASSQWMSGMLFSVKGTVSRFV